jgi:hypothetical protein
MASDGEENKKRSFTVEASSFDPNQAEKDTRYVSRSPYSAARKAARMLFDNHPNKGSVVRLTLRETTRGSKGKTYDYQARYVKTNETINVGGKTIKITGKIQVSSIPNDARLQQNS